MKVYIIGHKGWIGSMYIKKFVDNNIEYYYSDYRAEDDRLKKNILECGITHVLYCAGRTHGILNGKVYSTIDYLENKGTLEQNINDNLYSPLSLALFCDKNNIHLTYIGTGCIFKYTENKKIFYETDKPNFFGSNYSIVKGFTDQLMKQTNTLNLRIRMPITSKNNPRNFITKITTYEKICSNPNSMTVLDELIPVSIKMMKNKEIGTWNFTNPGVITHNEILKMYKKIVDPTFTWKNFTEKEQDKILLGERSNNYLSTIKLKQKYNVKPIKESIKTVLEDYITL